MHICMFVFKQLNYWQEIGKHQLAWLSFPEALTECLMDRRNEDIMRPAEGNEPFTLHFKLPIQELPDMVMSDYIGKWRGRRKKSISAWVEVSMRLF